MKKLTAGIFATLLAVVSADSAYAAIASQGYVDDKVEAVETTVAGKADSSTVTALDGRVDVAEGEIDTLQTQVAGKQDALKFTPENVSNKTTTLSGTSTDTQYPSAKAVWTAVQSVDANASVEALEGRVDSLETNSATKTELATKQNKNMGPGAANSIVTTDGTGNITTSATIASSKVSGLGALATKSSVATDDIASKAVTKEKLADDIVTSLGKADSALQKTTADTTYAVKALESQVGTVSKENMGTTTATTVVGGVKEAIEAAKAADTKADQAQSDATAAQGDVDALEAVVNNETTGLAAAHTAIDALESGKLDKTGTAARATADASGNVITTTYATKEEIANMATDENLALKQDKTDNSLETTNKTVVGAINEVRGTANSANTAAGAAQDAAEEAQATANAAIPKPSGECSNPANKCVLTFNNSAYAWEVIARGSEE